MNAPATFGSNLTALIAALPSDETRAPQTQFTLDLQIAFLKSLAVSGSVRSAARRVRVSHQTCYRARRSSAAFARAWDAAMVVARGQAEALLADYALGGIEEDVWYHGEIVGKRRRVSDRLLLAHLGRLDRLRTDPRIERLAEDFDGLIARMRAGGPIDPPVEERAAENVSSAQCNTRSMSPAGDGPKPAPAWFDDDEEYLECDCPGAQTGNDNGQPHFREYDGEWEPTVNCAGAPGPCCSTPDWPRCRDCPHFDPHLRVIHLMNEQRPEDAPALDELGDWRKVHECQREAFQVGDEDWWSYGEDWVPFELGADGQWVAVEELEAATGPEPDDGGEGAVPSCRLRDPYVTLR